MYLHVVCSNMQMLNSTDYTDFLVCISSSHHYIQHIKAALCVAGAELLSV